MVQYQLPTGVMDLSEVFGHIESSYEALQIEDYSVSQTTLDNVRPNSPSKVVFTPESPVKLCANGRNNQQYWELLLPCWQCENGCNNSQ